MKKRKRIKRIVIRDYNSLLRIKKGLEKVITQQEDEFMSDFATITKLTGLFGKNKNATAQGESVVNDLSSGLHSFISSNVSKAVDNLLSRFAKSEKSKKVVFIASTFSALALSAFISKKINRYLQNLTNPNK